jgi:methionine aminotransferase
MSPHLTSRLPEVGTSIFAVMSKMAADCGAINLSQGFPDFPVDHDLIDLIHKHMRAGHNQYAPMPGVSALRQALAEVIATTYPYAPDPDTEITITAGATEALFSSIAAFTAPGSEVIFFEPAYDCYSPAIRLNGGIPVPIALAPPFRIDWQQVEDKISPATRVIIINTPHNPAGVVLQPADLHHLERLAQKFGLLVISDEVYERLIYDGLAHESVLKYPAIFRQSVAVFSFGKTFHATGWKVGYTVAPPTLTAEIRKTHQFITFSVNTPVQWALADYLRQPAHYLNLSTFFQRKRDFFLDQLKGSSFEALPCEGSYFQLLSYRTISEKPDMAMAEWLTRTHRVAAIPVSVFYTDKTNHFLLRFCFAKSEETLGRATEILRKL